MSLKAKAQLGVRWNTVSTFATTGSNLLRLSILARYLDKSDFGLIAIVMFLLGFTTLFLDMGLTAAILHKQNISKKQYASIFWMNLVFSFIFYLILILFTPLFASFYDEKELLILIPIVGLNLIISAFGRQFRTIEQKEFNFKFIAINDSIASMINLLSAIFFAIKGFGVYALVYSTMLFFVVSNGIFFINGVFKRGLKFYFNFQEAKPFLKIGIYNLGGQIINYFNKDLDILIIGKIFGAEILGGYSLAKKLVYRPLQFINPIITKVASPTLARLQNDSIALKENFLKLITIISSLNIPVYIFIILFAHPIVFLFYGSSYDSIIPLVRILSLFMIFIAVRNPLGSLVIATGKTYLEFYWFLFSFPILPLAIYIGSRFSVEGVAWAISIAMLVLFLPFWKFFILKMIDVKFSEYAIAHIPNFKMIYYLTMLAKNDR